MPQGLRHFLPAIRPCLHSLDDVVEWTTLSICHIGPPDVTKCSFSKHWLLQCLLSSLLGEMLDVESYGQYGGKLCRLCQGCYVYSSWNKLNLPRDCQVIRNSEAIRMTWLHCYRQIHITSRGIFENIISSSPSPRTVSYNYSTITRFRLLYIELDPGKHTHKIGPTCFKSRGSGKPLQPAAILSRIHLEHNDHGGCNLFHSDMRQT